MTSRKRLPLGRWPTWFSRPAQPAGSRSSPTSVESLPAGTHMGTFLSPSRSIPSAQYDCVMRGLDPRIHDFHAVGMDMDARNKSGHDGGARWRSALALALAAGPASAWLAAPADAHGFGQRYDLPI